MMTAHRTHLQSLVLLPQGDPCCSWNYGDAPALTSDITHPSESSSKPTTRDSYSVATPAPVTSVVASYAAPGRLAVSFTPSRTYCEARVSLTVGATSITKGVRDPVAMFCETNLLSPGTNYSVSIVAINRFTGGSVPAVLTGYMPSSVTPFGAVPPPCTTNGVSPFVINTAAGRYTTLPEAPNVRLGVYGGSALIAAFLIIGAALVRCTGDASWLTRCLVHRPCCFRRKIVGGKSSWALEDFQLSGFTYFWSFLLAALAVAAAWAGSYRWFTEQVYAFGDNQRTPIIRSSGYALGYVMCLQLLPASRFSVFLHILGVPFERALRFHRWLGIITLSLVLVHGIGMILSYNQTPLGWRYNFGWERYMDVNPAAGVVSAVIMIFISISAMPPIRRAMYKVSVVTHALWPFAFLFAGLHTPHSDAPVAPVFALGAFLMAVDYLLMAADFFSRPTEMVAGGTVAVDPMAGGGRHGSRPAAGYLVLRKHDFPGVWQFR